MPRLSRNVYLLGLLSFFNDVTADMITPLLPAYLSSLGYSAAFLGALEGVANFFSYITMLFSGWLADRIGKSKRITVMGYLMSSVMRFLIAIPIGPVIFLGRVLDRVGKGIRTAPRDQLITASVDKAHWGKGFGVQRAMDHAGALVGTAVATFLLARYTVGFSKLFLFASIPAILSVLIVPIWIKDYPRKPSEKPARLSWRRLSPTVKLYVMVIFISAFSTPSQLFLLLKMQNLGMPTYQIPIAWLVLTVASMLGAYFGGPWGDRGSRRGVIGFGWVLFFLVYMGFAFNTHLTFAWVLVGIFGLQNGIVEASERAYMAGISTAETRATALGWYYFAYGIGLLPASVFFGWVWKYWSADLAFLLTAILTLVGVFLLFLLPSDRTFREHLAAKIEVERD